VVLSLRRSAMSDVTFELRAGNQASAKPSEVLAAVFDGLRARRLVKEAVTFAPVVPAPEPEKSE